MVLDAVPDSLWERGFELIQEHRELYLGCVVKSLNKVGSADDNPEEFFYDS